MAKISAEEKLEAVQRYLKGKESARAIAADLGVSHRYHLTWVTSFIVSLSFEKIDSEGLGKSFSIKYSNSFKACSILSARVEAKPSL